MGRHDAITRAERRTHRRFDDGTVDVATGLLLFGLGASLDLGEARVMVVAYAALVAFGLRFLFVWSRVGTARATGRTLGAAVLAFAVCFAVALAIALVLGVDRATGVDAASGWPDRVRLVSAATIWALAGFLAWAAGRWGVGRYLGYAVALAAAYALGPLVGLDARAWALALLGFAFAGIGAVRLRALRAANPPLTEDDAVGA
jgi:hypothetical protein